MSSCPRTDGEGGAGLLIRIAQAYDLFEIAHVRIRQAAAAGDQVGYIQALLDRAWSEMLTRDAWLEWDRVDLYRVWQRWFCEDIARVERLMPHLPLASRPGRRRAA